MWIAGRFPESAPISRAKDSKESVTIAARKAIPEESAPTAKKEESQKESDVVTEEKGKDRGVGAIASGT